MSRKRLLQLGSLVFVFGLLWQAPARLIGSFLPGDDVNVSGLSGSLWNGSASGISFGNTTLGYTSWSLNPLYLLIGSAKLQLTTNWAGNELTAGVRASLTGTISISDAEGFVDLRSLTPLLDLPISGQASLAMTELQISDAGPEAIVGTIRVRNLEFPDPINRRVVPLGDYELSFDSDSISLEEPAEGLLVDTGGPLELAGSVILTPPNSYAIDARIKPRQSAPPNLLQGLTMMAPVGPDGTHSFQMSSSF